MRVLILGASGLLGNTLFRYLCRNDALDVYGTTRSNLLGRQFSLTLIDRLLPVVDLLDLSQVVDLLNVLKPKVIINCISISDIASASFEKLVAVFSIFPRRLSQVCKSRNIRLIQYSSDGVFSGRRGGYVEDDPIDATDSYGIAKALGELDGTHVVTLRASVFGPEIRGGSGLLSWFLDQQGECRGYTRALFSGLPSVVHARILNDFIIPNETLSGVYHLAAEPISKYNLLLFIKSQYGLDVRVIPDDSVISNRSLSAERFHGATGYSPPSWREMIAAMHAFTYGLRES